MNVRTRKERLLDALSSMSQNKPTTNGLLIYKELTEAINQIEDIHFPFQQWDCPRSFLQENRTDRLYTILPESFHPVTEWPGVTILIARYEIAFISRYGAFEIQKKLPDDCYGVKIPFFTRTNQVIFSKLDYQDHGVWHIKNKS